MKIKNIENIRSERDEAIRRLRELDVKYENLLERSNNSNYEKCAEAIYSSTFSSKEIFTVEKIVQILKAHFA